MAAAGFVVPPDDADIAAGIPITPDDFVQLENGNPDGASSIEFTPTALLKLAGIDEAAIAAFAERFGIANQDALRATLEVIAKNLGDPVKAVKVWSGNELASSLEEIKDVEQAYRLCGALHELLARASWPVGAGFGSVPVAVNLLQALNSYGDWLDQFQFIKLKPKRSRPAMENQKVVVTALVLIWEKLTGKKPVCQNTNKEYPFYLACEQACHLFGIHPAPGKSLVRDLIASAKETILPDATKSRTEA